MSSGADRSVELWKDSNELIERRLKSIIGNRDVQFRID